MTLRRGSFVLALASMLFLSYLSWYFQVWEVPAFVAYPLGPTVVPPLVEPPPVDWPVLPLLEPLLLPPWLQSRSRSLSLSLSLWVHQPNQDHE